MNRSRWSSPRLVVSLLVGLGLLAGCGPGGVGTDEDDALGDENVGAEQAISISSYAVGQVLRTTSPLNLRSSPAVESNNVVTVLPDDARVTLVASAPTAGFYNVHYGAKNVSGWAYGAYLLDAKSTILKWGIYPDASDALRDAGVTSSRIMQTIGNAAASAGTHAQDGTVNGAPYSAATDISVSGMSDAQIKDLLHALAQRGFVPYYRNPGHDGWPSSEIRHMHVVYTGAKMKSSLRSQVSSWLAGRNGLVSNTIYTFYTWSTADKNIVRALYSHTN